MDAVKTEMRKQILSQIFFNKMSRKFEESKNSRSYEEFFAQNKKSSSFQFMNNFKCLQGQKNNSPNIDYSQVYAKFQESLKKHEKNFEFTTSDKKAIEIDSDFLLIEEILLEKYLEMSSEITKKKGVLIKLRESIAFSLSTVRRLQGEVTNIKIMITYHPIILFKIQERAFD